MTDNEKRAHDLALIMTLVIYDRDYRGTNKKGGDIYEEYKKSYDEILKDVNYDFPK